MVGQVLGAVGGLPQIFTELEVSYYLLKRLLGVRTEGDKKGAKVAKLSKSEVLMVNIGSLSTGNIEHEILASFILTIYAYDTYVNSFYICTSYIPLGGRVIAVKADLAKIGLTNPGN